MGFGRRGTEQQSVEAPPSVAPAEPADVTATPVAAPEAPEVMVPKAVPVAPEPKAKPRELKAKASKGMAEMAVSPQPMTATINEKLAEIKITVTYKDLIGQRWNLAEISKLSESEVREAITDIVAEIISILGLALSVPELQQVVVDICNDILGLGPAAAVHLGGDDIADITGQWRWSGLDRVQAQD